jgi:hypothetical protein
MNSRNSDGLNCQTSSVSITNLNALDAFALGKASVLA